MHRFLFKVAVAVILFCSGNKLCATTTYLLVEGKFPSSAGSLTTYIWEVQYSGSQLLSGQDLLNVVFGTPIVTGAPIGGQTYSASNGTNGALYPYSAVYGFYPSRFTIDGLQGEETPANYSSYWSYFSAGGGYNDTSGTGYNDPVAGPYDGGAWAYGATGPSDRLLEYPGGSAPSFDAFTFGQGSAPSILPTVSAFNGATVINLNSVPEPGRVMLLALGVVGIMQRRNRRSHNQSHDGES